MANLNDSAKSDWQRFTSSGGFEVSITLKSPLGVEAVVGGLATKHFLSIDTDGAAVNSKNVHVSISEALLTAASYPVRNASGEVAMYQHKVQFIDSTGTLNNYSVSETFPDEKTGMIVFVLVDRVEDFVAPSVSISATDSSISLSWTFSGSGQNAFEIYRSILPTGRPTLFATVADDVLDYNDETPIVGVFYQYQIRAIFDENKGAFSDAVVAELIVVDAPAFLQAVDLTDDSNQDGLLLNPNLIPDITDLIEPNSSNISAMASKVDAFLTRIASTNTALEILLHERMRYISRSQVAYWAFLDCPIYLMWPDSKAQGIVPMFPLTGTAVPEDRLQEYGAGCSYSAADGVGADGTTSTWYVPMNIGKWAGVGNSYKYAAYIQISQVASANTYMGAYQNTGLTVFRSEGGKSASAYLYFGNIILRWNLSTPNNHLIEVIGEGSSRKDNTNKSNIYSGGDYDTPHNTATYASTSNNLTFSDNYLLLLHARTNGPFPTTAPYAFGDQKISSLAFWRGGSHEASKIISEQMDQWKIDKTP